MYVSHYLLLGFFSGPAAPTPDPQPPAGGVARPKPRRFAPRPVWQLPPPRVPPADALEDEEVLLMVGAL